MCSVEVIQVNLQHQDNPEAKEMPTVVCGRKIYTYIGFLIFFLMAVIPCAKFISEFFYSILFSSIKSILIPGLPSSQKQESLASEVSWILLGNIFMVSHPKRVRNLRKFGKVIITLTGMWQCAVPTCTHSPTCNSFNFV